MNMKFAGAAALACISFAAMASRAAAADNGFYLGAGITDSTYNIDDFGGGSSSFDDNSFKAIVGIRPLDWLAVEANYLDLSGEIQGNSFDSKVFTVSGLLLAEFGIVDLYARGGMAKWDANWNFPIGGSSAPSTSDDGWEPTYGLGVGVHFGSIGARIEYERFSAHMFETLDTHTDTLSLSVTYTFL
jgi:OOP family OmpA-OmpF porin